MPKFPNLWTNSASKRVPIGKDVLGSLISVERLIARFLSATNFHNLLKSSSYGTSNRGVDTSYSAQVLIRHWRISCKCKSPKPIA